MIPVFARYWMLEWQAVRRSSDWRILHAQWRVLHIAALAEHLD
jgi:hypothetical protein